MVQHFSGFKMMGSFLTRGLVMIFGYAYPAYECFKTVEKNKPEIEQLRFWCQYWILVAMLTVFERVGDTFVSWVPMYSEAKLAFFIYLWYPKTKGTTYVYDSFFRPYIAKHETEIDRNLLELKTRAGDMAILYWQKAASYGQTRVFEILQYVASQSTARPRPAQFTALRIAKEHLSLHGLRIAKEYLYLPSSRKILFGGLLSYYLNPCLHGMDHQEAGVRHPPPTVRTQQADVNAQQPPQQPPEPPQQPPQPSQQAPSRTSSTGSSQKQPPSRTNSLTSTQQQQAPSRTSSTGITQHQQETALDKAPPVPSAPAATVQVEAAGASQPAAQLSSQPTQTEAELMRIEQVSSTGGNVNPPAQDTVMEEVIRVTRSRLRRNRAAAKS
ncbi:hypothetical protein IFM89_014742 [Coptis chinensis]|uniref:HVA22-like protein n=1 Tax=Coptis chinensis TaxID=261450 RepID=A0A835IN16_9MAGN|nr:hypothetical protein IFM89_014742 [Coptis chinensis]